MKTKLIGYLSLAAAMMGVGSTVVASRIAGDGLPPFTAAALRFLIASPLLYALMRAQRLRWPRLAPRELGLLVVQAACGGVGYTVLLIVGTRLSALATAGVLLVTLTPGRTTLSTRALAGDALVLAAVACEAVFILLNRRLAVPLAPLTQSSAMSAAGCVLALAPAAFEWRAATAAAWQPAALAAIAYYALVPTVLGYLCWYAGSARTSGTEAALFTAVAPASAVLFAAAAFGEPLDRTRLAGIAMVVAGVLVGAIRPRCGAHRPREAAAANSREAA
ncbi:transmembrane protein [Burkholderia pseudomallei]|uniref:DMT family transporter n=1 Tax=Burkholderia pseudomallei TaxID=28450 RepID=UPI000F07F463|nr:DMT family transporter [Burkholderia pseudomallei]VCD33792.1 transmembrane protein [Burkholderia pseudomallei]